MWGTEAIKNLNKAGSQRHQGIKTCLVLHITKSQAVTQLSKLVKFVFLPVKLSSRKGQPTSVLTPGMKLHKY